VEQSSNPLAYYNKVNQRVSYSDAQTVANLIKAEQPGNYSILQIAETYRWVRANIEYLIDANGDYWQSAKETLSLGTGDCEDHAILMASIIGALGGNARVNLIDQHAFATVYVASGYSGLMKVKQALASYYGIDNQTYEMAYLVDQYGYWLVVDTTGFPYAGGIPANSEAVSLTGNWTVLSTYLYKVDATGVTSSNGFFGLF
jgi:transglutaminase-like putative cysteine protease